VSTQSGLGLWEWLEEVDCELLDRDSKVEGGLGVASTDELLLSGVWPAHNYQYNVKFPTFQMFYAI